jgi:hypothetical protein
MRKKSLYLTNEKGAEGKPSFYLWENLLALFFFHKTLKYSMPKLKVSWNF